MKLLVVFVAIVLVLLLASCDLANPSTYVPPSTLKGHVYKCLDSTGHIFTTDSPWGQICVRIG